MNSSRNIPVYQPYLTGREKDYVNNCLETTWISSRGEFIGKFESKFLEFVGTKHATAVCNGTVALHLALLALGIGPGDEVIVPTFTYVASVNMILLAGATPVFADSLSDTWQIDPQQIERAITPRTKAVMVVHLYGGATDMAEVSRICRKHNLLLIEDCAEALGTYFADKHVGTFGDIATFSFFGNKTITTGEGGMVVMNDPELFKKAHHLKTQAVSPVREYWHDMLGFNYRMTNICAAIGLAQLEHVDEILEKKRKITGWYDKYLSAVEVRRQVEPVNTRHSWWLYSILVPPQYRDDLRVHLRRAGVETRPLFPPVHTMPHCLCEADFPIATGLSEQGISLPSFPGLEEAQVDFIAGTIAEFFKGVDVAQSKAKMASLS